MKKLTDYIAESEQWMESPSEGDTFGIELEDDTLLETYVMEVAEDGSVLLDSTEEIYSLLESWNMLSEDIDGDVVEKAMSPRNTTEVEEAAPLIPLAAMAGGALARHAGAGALGQMAGRVAGHAVGSAIDRKLNQEPVNELDTGCGCDHDHTADVGEYDEEGDMAKNELLTIVRAARRLTGMLDNDDNMPEWTQKKITKAADYVDTAADYISSQKERGIMEQPDDGNPVARAVLHRIMMQHPGVLAQHGPERVMNAVDELADRVNIGPDDEIGTSDVSGWTRDVIRMLAELPDEPMNVGDALDESGVAEGSINTYILNVMDEATGEHWAIEIQATSADMAKERAQQQGFKVLRIREKSVTEAEYQGRDVPLGKPMRGDVAKFKVYVKDPSTGNVKKVNFGDPDMKIRKSNPKARKSFRARHNCDNPGPKTKARYWSCRKW